MALGFAYQGVGRKKDAIGAYGRYLKLRPEAENRKELEDRIYSLEGD